MPASGRRSHQHFERIGGRLERRFEHRDLRGNSAADAFGLVQAGLGQDAARELEARKAQQMLLRRQLLAGDGQARLQRAHEDVGVGCLGDHLDARRGRTGIGGLVVRQRRLPVPPQAAENIDLPARAAIDVVELAVAVDAEGLLNLPDGRLHRLMGGRRRSIERAARQQRRAGDIRGGARLADTRDGLREIQILGERLVDHLVEHRVAEGAPPGGEGRLAAPPRAAGRRWRGSWRPIADAAAYSPDRPRSRSRPCRWQAGQ